MFFVFARYRYPLVPFLMLFAAAPFDSTRARLHRAHVSLRAIREDGSWQRSLLAVAIFANWPVLSPTLMMAITENNLGTALLEQRRYDQAIAHHERAIALHARLRARPTTTSARRCARPAGSTKRWRDTGRRSSSSPTSPARATTSPTRCSNRARPAIRRQSFRRALESNPELGRGAQQPRHRARQPRRCRRRDRRVPRRAGHRRSLGPRASQSRQHAGRRRAARRRDGASRARGAAGAVGARSGLRHRHDPAAGSELPPPRRRGSRRR